MLYAVQVRSQRLRSDLTGELFKRSTRLAMFYQRSNARLTKNAFCLDSLAIPLHSLRCHLTKPILALHPVSSST